MMEGELIPARKTCTRCGIEQDASQFSPHKSHCKQCFHDDWIARQHRKMEWRSAVIDGDSRKALQEFIKASKGVDSSNLPHMTELLRDAMRAFGGTTGFAQQFMSHMLSSKAGSMVRQRCFEMLFHLTSEVSKQNYVKLPEEMSDEELRTKMDAFNVRRQKVMAKLGLVDADGHIRGSEPNQSSAAG